ncbi:unnamed protein product [Mucor circinelloides]
MYIKARKRTRKPNHLNLIVVVDGYLFPKDSIINAHMMSVHMDPHFYKNPTEFNPERFLPYVKSLHAAASGKLEERDTFVFGFGRRLCPGIHLVSTIRLAVALSPSRSNYLVLLG